MTNTVGSLAELNEIVSWADVPVVVLFTAPAWCQPCRRFETHWEQVQERMEDILFLTVDMGETVEETGDHWASKAFNILGVPVVKMFIGDDITNIKARAIVPLIRELSQ